MLAATSVMALVQFRPGRIDHHNAQILCAVAGLLFLLVRSLDEQARRLDRRRPARAGPRGRLRGDRAGRCLRSAWPPSAALWQSRARAPARRGACARLPPCGDAVRRWSDCPAHALARHALRCAVAQSAAAGGMVHGGPVGGHALWRAPGSHPLCLRGRAARRRRPLYGALEPACLAGPFGQVSPALKPLWLDHVMETKSIFWLGASHPAPALALVAFVLAGAAAQIALWRQRRDMRNGLATAIIVLAARARVLADQADAVCELARGAAARRIRRRAARARRRSRPAWCASPRSCC